MTFPVRERKKNHLYYTFKNKGLCAVNENKSPATTKQARGPEAH